jgi:hypothetical protein
MLSVSPEPLLLLEKPNICEVGIRIQSDRFVNDDRLRGG